jgi:hypothetical protein
MTRSRQTADWGSRAGLAKIVPSSVAVGSGTGSANAFGTVTFSGCSSVSLNDVFSATYTNYRIVGRITGTSNGAILSYQNRVSATNAATNYGFIEIEASGIIVSASNMTAQTSTRIGKVQNSKANSIDTLVTGPFLAERTSLFTNNYFDAPAMTIYGSQHTTETSYTGFTIAINTGTISGTISVYGLN